MKDSFSLGWNKNLSSRDYVKKVLKNEDSLPYFVMMEIEKGVDPSSRDICVNFDDYATGPFYYRDWTSSSLPFVEDGEIYWSGFWFQNFGDAKKFVTLYGGSGNWMKGHKQFVQECNNRR